MSAATGRPRPFLAGVFRTACNYCVRSKKGCSGGNPCEQCQKQGKNCVYAQRRISGPRGRPSGRSHRVRARAKARRENRATAIAGQSTQPAYLESSKFVKQGNEDGGGMNILRQCDNIARGALGGHYGHNLPLPISQDYYHSVESTSSGLRSSPIEAMNESLQSISSSDDGEYQPSDGDGSSGDMMNIAAVEYFPTRGTGFSSRGGSSIYGGSIGVAGHDGIQDMLGANTTGEASSEQNNHCIRLAPLTKLHSSLPFILGDSFGGDDANDKYYAIGCCGERKPLISVKDSGDLRKSAPAKSSSTRHISSPSGPNGNCTQCLDSTSPVSEVQRQLKHDVTPIGAPLGVIPTSSPSGGLNLQSPAAKDDLPLVDCFSNWTEHDPLQLERDPSADLYHGGGRMFPGRASGGKQQDPSHHHQKQQQKQQQNASQEVFSWKDEDALDKAAFAAAAAAANADVNLIQIYPQPRIKRDKPFIDPPLHQSLFAEVIPPVFLPSSTGGADISPANLGRQNTDNHFVDALPYPRAKVPRREIGLKAHVTSSMISGGTVDEGDVHTVFAPMNATPSPPISIESAILMDLDRSMKVAAGTELHDEFVDLDFAIKADIPMPRTREASLIRVMEEVGSEVLLGANSNKQ